MPYLRIVKTGLTTESISEIIHLSINPFIYAERLFKLVIFSTLLKPLISVAVEKSETKPFLRVFDRPHMLYMAGKLMTSATRVIGNLLL